MSRKPDTRSRWRPLLILAGVGLLIAVPLAWYGYRTSTESTRRARINANEQAALTNLDAIGAAQHAHLRAQGQYATFQQLAEGGFLDSRFAGDAPVLNGYTYYMRVTPRSDAQAGTYAINADPVRSDGPDATGLRHFYAGSDVTGVRFAEGRPASASDALLQRRSAY